MEAADIAFLENVTGGTRCVLLPIGVPVPQAPTAFVTFYDRVEKGRDFSGPLPLMIGSPKPLTIRLMPRY